jgi:hypothetical protein
MPHETGDYGVSTNVYAYVALILVLLTFGMETTLFRFANDERSKPDTVFTTAMAVVGSLTAVFLLASCLCFIAVILTAKLFRSPCLTELLLSCDGLAAADIRTSCFRRAIVQRKGNIRSHIRNVIIPKRIIIRNLFQRRCLISRHVKEPVSAHNAVFSRILVFMSAIHTSLHFG